MQFPAESTRTKQIHANFEPGKHCKLAINAKGQFRTKANVFLMEPNPRPFRTKKNCIFENQTEFVKNCAHL